MNKKVLLLAILSVVNLTASADVEINETNFPDPNFRNWVLSQDYGADGVLTDDEIVKVTEIVVQDKDIQSLKGIEYFTALTNLDCYNNQLTALDVSKNTALTWLRCDSNQLTTLNVSKNTALTTLNCGTNQLTALDVSQNTALIKLRCHCNLLTALDVSQNTALTELYCSANQLTTLDVSKNTALTELNCITNQIRGAGMDALVESLPVVSTANLNIIYNNGDEQNEMTTVQVAAAQAKGWTPYYYYDRGWYVYAGSEPTAHVEINETNFPDPNFRNWVLGRDSNGDGVLSDAEIACVTSINLKERDLHSLKGIEYFTALTSLYCNHNKLTALDVSGCTALKVLHCYSNRITALDVSGCTALTELQCYSCPLKTLDVTKNTALTQLVCYYNQLTALDVSQNTELTQLICNYNQLTALDVSQNIKLDTLKCEINQLTALDVTKNTKLEYLDCSQNQLTALDASKNTALKWLRCYQNQLATLDVSGCTALTILNCSENQLTTLDVSVCTALTSLNCSENQLTMLDVSKNTLLTFLGCGWNLLTTLDLSQNISLAQLAIWHNQIRGAGMDALVASLPMVSSGELDVIVGGNEQNEMTTAQVAAAKAKGWIPYADGQPYVGSEPTYRPFVEEGKLWVINASADVDGETTLRWIDYCYLEGDTIIDGQTCKKMKYITNVNEENWVNGVLTPATSIQGYIGTFYEQDKKVFFARNGKQQFELLYDFTLSTDDTIDVGGSLFTVKKMSGGITGFKGTYYDLWHYDQFIERWLEGVGSESWPYVNDPWLVDGARGILLACSVDDEVIYCNSNMEYPYIVGAQRQRFDFTHTIKSQPKAPMGTLATLPAEAESLYGEYNDLQLGINLDSLDETYLVHITDKSGKVVYEKTINADNIVGLNIDISNYAEGRYTVTVENNYESFVGEFDTQTTGIEENAIIEKLKNESIYNLQGQRISSLQKGLNIVNGQKIFVK